MVWTSDVYFRTGSFYATELTGLKKFRNVWARMFHNTTIDFPSYQISNKGQSPLKSIVSDSLTCCPKIRPCMEMNTLFVSVIYYNAMVNLLSRVGNNLVQKTLLYLTFWILKTDTTQFGLRIHFLEIKILLEVFF